MSMVENGCTRQQRTRRRLRTTTMMVFLYFSATIWLRDVVSFRTTVHRRIAGFSSKNFICISPPRSTGKFHHRQKHRVAAALVTGDETEAEISATPKTVPPPTAFDYRRIPPISDTTPCEVVQAFDRDRNDLDTSQGDVPCHEEQEFYFPSPDELAALPKGDRGGYHIVRQYTVVGVTATTTTSDAPFTKGETITLQHALTVLDPKNYPTLTRARKSCRKGMVLVVHPSNEKKFRKDKQNATTTLNQEDSGMAFKRGSVGDLVSPGDVIGVQMFLGTYRKKQCYPNIEYSRPQFQLPILYEDDHLAVVNKPAGVAVYSETRNGGGDKTTTGTRKTVHFALPFVLTPPKRGTKGGILRRPGIVHRIDKPTSGLLVVAKTKAAMDHLYQQFRERRIQKMYTAIVNGDLMPHQKEYRQQQQEKEKGWQTTQNQDNKDAGVDADDDCWNLIDYPLGGKHALTSWKILKRARSLNARDGVLTMVQVRLHTGRYHQIRRHFARWCMRPLVGDHLHAGLLQAHHFRKKGLFLSSNGISFLHPVVRDDDDDDDDDSNGGGNAAESANRRVVEVTIDVPKRFDKLMKAEDSWAIYKSTKE